MPATAFIPMTPDMRSSFNGLTPCCNPDAVWRLRTRLAMADVNMTESRRLLQHFLGALAYRTQKALRDAPDSFADFRISPTSRTPFELVWHMTGVIGYARTFLHGGDFEPPRLESFAAEIARFHDTLTSLSRDFADDSLKARITDEQFLQGPLADAMTHAG